MHLAECPLAAPPAGSFLRRGARGRRPHIAWRTCRTLRHWFGTRISPRCAPCASAVAMVTSRSRPMTYSFVTVHSPHFNPPPPRPSPHAHPPVVCAGSGCSAAWHMRCLPVPLIEVPPEDWLCPSCDPSPPEQAPPDASDATDIIPCEGETAEAETVAECSFISSPPSAPSAPAADSALAALSAPTADSVSTVHYGTCAL